MLEFETIYDSTVYIAVHHIASVSSYNREGYATILITCSDEEGPVEYAVKQDPRTVASRVNDMLRRLK